MVTIEDRVADLLLDEAAPVTSGGRSVEVRVGTGLALSDLGRGEEAGVGQGQRSGLRPVIGQLVSYWTLIG